MGGADDDLVDTTWASLAGAAVAIRYTRQRQQFKRNVFQDVARPGAGFQALQKTAAYTRAAAVLDQARQPGREPLVESRQGVGGEVFQFANVHQRFDDGDIGPDARSAQVRHAQDLDVFVAHENGVERYNG